MYILVNSSLSMTKGKIAAQVGHAVQKYMERLFDKKENHNDYLKWTNNGSKKVVLKATQEQLEYLKQFDDAIIVIDSGHTQVPPNSLTVVAYPPNKQSKFSNLSDYKLL